MHTCVYIYIPIHTHTQSICILAAFKYPHTLTQEGMLAKMFFKSIERDSFEASLQEFYV